MHEQLNEFKLINMNARLYDPILGRFVQPDNEIQAPANIQNFNRYSYVMNNSLNYTDPSGQWIHLVIGAVVGGIINVAVHWNQIMSSPNPWATGAIAFGIGAAGGFVAAATFGAGVAAVGGMGAATMAQIGVIGGTSALAGDMVSNGLNHIYFGDPLRTPKEQAMIFATGAALSMVGKGISDALGPKKPLYPEQMQRQEVKLSDAVKEASDESLMPTKMSGPNQNPIPIDDGPKLLNVDKKLQVDRLVFHDKKVEFQVSNMSRSELMSKLTDFTQSTNNSNLYYGPNKETIMLYNSIYNQGGGIPTLQYNNGNGYIRYFTFTKP